MMAVGAASPIAHGQETTSTAKVNWRAKGKPSIPWVSTAPEYARASHTTSTTSVTITTIGMNTIATLSAVRCMAGFDAWACSTSLPMEASMLFDAVAIARM